MANPNIVGVQYIRGRTANRKYVKRASRYLVRNNASSNEILKINTITATNISTASHKLTVQLVSTQGTSNIVSAITIPPKTTLNIIQKNHSIYLEEDSSINVFCTTSNDKIGIFCSYEQISTSVTNDRIDIYDADTAEPTPDIATSGLVVYLDAGNPESYDGTSTWRDLSGNSNHMTLFNTPTYSSANNGVLQFNGTNQYARIASLNYSTTTFTIMAASRYSGSTRGRVITSINNNWLFGHWQNGSEEYYAEGWIREGTPNDLNFRIYAGVENYTTDQRSFYVNNSAIVTNSTAGSQGFNGLQVGGWGSSISEWSTCEVGFILVYNRILTTEEMTQNYNVFRSRYGL